MLQSCTWLPPSIRAVAFNSCDKTALYGIDYTAVHRPGCLQASTSAQPLALRCLDISGSTAFPDADLARLLRACPQLEVLRAARTQFGPECLAALCGRPAAAGSSGPAAQHQQEQQGRSWPRPSCCARLHTLDISHCLLLVAGPGGDSCGALLPRALCHLSSLVDLRLNGVSAVAAGPLFEAPERLAAASGSSGAAATLARVLGQLTRLELLETAADCQAGDPRWPKPGAPASTRGSNSSGGGLAWRHVEALVRHCTALRRLALSSWQLAAAQGAAAGPLGRYSSNLLSPTGPEAGGAAEQGQGQLPSLLHLEVGWGAGGAMLWHLLRASPYLASLRVHAGAVVSDWHLEQLAQRCRYLARLELRAANVTEQGGGGGQGWGMLEGSWARIERGARASQCPCLLCINRLRHAWLSLQAAPCCPAGVACVLAACSQLTSLRLHSCVGALTDGVALTPPLPSWAPAFKIQELCLSGSACALLSDWGVDALLAPSFAALRCLSLRGCSRASDAGLWPALQQHAATLECLELEECGSLARRCKLKRPGALAGGELAVGLPAPLSAAPAADTVGSCQQLQALTIRGSVVCQDATALARLRESCAGVPSVVLSADAAMY